MYTAFDSVWFQAYSADSPAILDKWLTITFVEIALRSDVFTVDALYRLVP